MVSVILSVKRLLGEQSCVMALFDISTWKESVAAGKADKEPLTHYQSISASWTVTVSLASGARNGNSPAASQCAAAGIGMLGWESCVCTCHSALPVVGRAAETLSCPCHTGIRFLRSHLLPCWFCKHFRVTNPVGRTVKHMGCHWKSKNELCFACKLELKGMHSLLK